MVPGADDTAVLSAGRYTVTVAESVSIAALSVARLATLFVAQGDPLTLSVAGDSSNAGTIRLGGSALHLGGTLVNTGVIEGESYTTGDRLIGGTVINHGLLDTYGRGAWIVQSTIDNRADGTIRSDAFYSMLLLGTVSNAGLIEAVDATIETRFSDFVATVTNLNKSALVGGHWRVSGTGVMELAGQHIQELRDGADVELSGRSARLTVNDGNMVRGLDETLVRISTGSALHVLDGRDFGTGQRLDVFGTLELAGGKLSVADLQAGAGSSLIGFGTVAGEANLGGAVSVEGGALRFDGDATIGGSVSGTGVLTLAGGDNRLIAGADVTIGTLMLEGGTTRIETGDVHAGSLVMNGATLNFAPAPLTIAGSVELHDALVFGSTLRLTGAELTSSGSSRLATAVFNTGTITVDGTLTIDGTLVGAGHVVVHDGGTMVFGEGAAVGRSQVIDLEGAAAVEIATPGKFAAALAGFDRGDTIVLAGFSAESTRARWLGNADGVGGTLRVIGDTDTVVLHFNDGAYVRRNFALFDLNSGELGITFRDTRGSAAAVPSEAFGSDTHAPSEHLFLAGATLLTDGSMALV